MELLSIQTIDRAHVVLKITAVSKQNWFNKIFLGRSKTEVSFIGSGKDWAHEGTGLVANSLDRVWLSARWDEWQWKRTNGLHQTS